MEDKIYVKQALKDLLASFIDMDLDESICGEIRETNAEKIKKCQNILTDQLLSTKADNQSEEDYNKTNCHICGGLCTGHFIDKHPLSTEDKQSEGGIPRDVEILLESSSDEYYKTDERRIGFQQGAKWMRERWIEPTQSQTKK